MCHKGEATKSCYEIEPLLALSVTLVCVCAKISHNHFLFECL